MGEAWREYSWDLDFLTIRGCSVVVTKAVGWWAVPGDTGFRPIMPRRWRAPTFKPKKGAVPW